MISADTPHTRPSGNETQNAPDTQETNTNPAEFDAESYRPGAGAAMYSGPSGVPYVRWLLENGDDVEREWAREHLPAYEEADRRNRVAIAKLDVLAAAEAWYDNRNHGYAPLKRAIERLKEARDGTD